MPLWWSLWRCKISFVFVLFETNTENEVYVRERHFHWWARDREVAPVQEPESRFRALLPCPMAHARRHARAVSRACATAARTAESFRAPLPADFFRCWRVLANLERRRGRVCRLILHNHHHPHRLPKNHAVPVGSPGDEIHSFVHSTSTSPQIAHSRHAFARRSSRKATPPRPFLFLYTPAQVRSKLGHGLACERVRTLISTGHHHRFSSFASCMNVFHARTRANFVYFFNY